MEERLIRKEMTSLKWLAKITERLNIIQLSIKEKIEIREDDIDVIKELHWFYSMGHLPFYENILIDAEGKGKYVTQQDLFSTNSQSPDNGTEIDTSNEENQKEEKNDTKETIQK